jgi:trypsin
MEYGKVPFYYSVRVGSTSQLTGGDIHKVKGVYVHPFFDPDSYDYDVALLLLNSSIAIDGITKKIIQLPFFGQAVFEMTPCVVSGWGETQNFNETNINLRSVNLYVSNQKECHKYYSDVGGITWRMICAFAPKKDSCSGDSGGPMVRISDNKLVGIVSYGPANTCADPVIPGVYTRVSNVRIWIRFMTRV